MPLDSPDGSSASVLLTFKIFASCEEFGSSCSKVGQGRAPSGAHLDHRRSYGIAFGDAEATEFAERRPRSATPLDPRPLHPLRG